MKELTQTMKTIGQVHNGSNKRLLLVMICNNRVYSGCRCRCHRCHRVRVVVVVMVVVVVVAAAAAAPVAVAEAVAVAAVVVILTTVFEVVPEVQLAFILMICSLTGNG